MDERFPDEFVTWHHKTPVGIKIDEVFGMDSKTGRTWLELASQIYCEQGEPNYRVIEHFSNGAPYIEGYPGRVSISHTKHLFVAATLPKTPEADLAIFSQRAAMGIDAEPIDREQVVKVRSKFLSEEERKFIPDDNIEMNVMAWTSKEALLKTSLMSGIDYQNNLIISKLPSLQTDPLKDISPDQLGKGYIKFPEGTGLGLQEINLYSYISYGCIVTIAFSPKCAKFGKK